MNESDTHHLNTESAVAILGRVADSCDTYLAALHRRERRDAMWSIAKRIVFAIIAAALIGFWFKIYAPLLGARHDPYAPSVVIVDIRGHIGRDTSTADKIVPLVQRACRQETARALILKISSPGGSPTDAERIAAAVAACRKSKPDLPIAAVIEGIGASAAYLIASEADEVIANRYAVVGSIGAIATSVDASEAARHFGVIERTYASGPLKAGNGLFTPNSIGQDAMMQSLVDGVASVFATQVTKARGDRLKLGTPDLFSGRVWMADEALAIGLIDRVDVLDNYLADTYPGLMFHIYRPTKTLNEYLGVEGVVRGAVREVLADLREVRVE